MANKSARKSAKNGARKNNNSKPMGRMPAIRVVLFVLLVIIGLAAIFALLKSSVPGFLGGASLSGKLAASVNGQEITMAELDEGYNSLPVQYQLFLTKEDFLDQMIDQVLLRQEASRRGIVITDQEAEQYITDFLLKNNVSDEQYMQLLENGTIDKAELIIAAKDQIMVKKIIETEVSSKVNVSEEEARQYYNENREAFVDPASMVVRHILLGTLISNRTADETDALARKIISEVEPDKSNFCTLVSEYSEDASSLAKCGEYTFIEGQLPDEFDNWSKASKPGDVGIVQTLYGYHVIWLVSKEPEHEQPFVEVREQVVSSLAVQQERIIYQEFMDTLRQSADIRNYLAKETADNDPDEGYEMVADEPAMEPDGENMAAGEDSMVKDEPAEEPAMEIKDEPAQETNAAVNVLDDSGYVKCLASKGAVLYGASWNTDTNRQVGLLGADASSIRYIECAVPGDYKTQAKACSGAGVEAYPTWSVNGHLYPGVYAPRQIGELAGC